MEEGGTPCLWILGAMDNYINCEQIQAKVRLPRNAEMVILKNSGHLGFIEEEEQSLKAIESFIEKLT
jgi:pimeloyl-ACP methyl ester carboxylesterase